MKKQALLIILGLLILANFNYISAAVNNSDRTIPGINLNYPSSVNFCEENNFDLTMNNFPDDIYDVRIGVLEDSNRIARIWNGNEWQSTYYYIIGAMNTDQINSKTFKLNITSCYTGIANVEVKIRDSKGKTYAFNNYTVNVIGNCNNNNAINNSNNNNDNESSSDENTNDNSDSNEDISLNIDWSGDMINGNDFDVNIKADNLLDKSYDVKVYIYDSDKNKPISQVYFDNNWISSTSYINEFLEGPGHTSKTLKLRIKDSFKDFEGEATIDVRLREHGKTVYMKEIEASTEITPPDITSQSTTDTTNSPIDNYIDNSIIPVKQKQENINEIPTSDEIIHIGNSKIQSESIKSKKNIVYESKNESIKKYSIYSFTVLLVIFLGFLVLLNLKKKKW